MGWWDDGMMGWWDSECGASWIQCKGSYGGSC